MKKKRRRGMHYSERRTLAPPDPLAPAKSRLKKATPADIRYLWAEHTDILTGPEATQMRRSDSLRIARWLLTISSLTGTPTAPPPKLMMHALPEPPADWYNQLLDAIR